MSYLSKIVPALCYLAILLMTIGGAYKDGLSERARESDKDPNAPRVGYQPWHMWGHIGRVCPQLIVLSIGVLFVNGWLMWFYVLFSGATALIGHLYAYDHAIKNRALWLWGQKIPKWMKAWNQFWSNLLGIE
jgi:hypothetical protein